MSNPPIFAKPFAAPSKEDAPARLVSVRKRERALVQLLIAAQKTAQEAWGKGAGVTPGDVLLAITSAYCQLTGDTSAGDLYRAQPIAQDLLLRFAQGEARARAQFEELKQWVEEMEKEAL